MGMVERDAQLEIATDTGVIPSLYNERLTMEEYRLGKYSILDELGKGGFGTVYRALDTTLDRKVALKILDPVLLRDTDWELHLRREARAVAKLDYPGIVTIYEVDEVDGRLFIAMQLIDGPNLAEYLESRGLLPWDDVLRVMSQVTEALDYAHRAGVLHRDLKPANILMDSSGNAALTDFGLARIVGESKYGTSLTGGIVGTPQYIAPEVWEEEKAGKPADIYALGCILYELLTGERLFRGKSAPAVMRSHLKPLRLPESWPDGVPAGVTEILQTALAKDPADRYASAGDMARTLERLAASALAEPYIALQTAVEAGAWEQALELVAQIRATDPDYRDVVALEKQALQGTEQAARAERATEWQRQAEEALAEGDVDGALRAVNRWQMLSPDDHTLAAFLAQLERASTPRLSKVASSKLPEAKVQREPAKQIIALAWLKRGRIWAVLRAFCLVGLIWLVGWTAGWLPPTEPTPTYEPSNTPLPTSIEPSTTLPPTSVHTPTDKPTGRPTRQLTGTSESPPSNTSTPTSMPSATPTWTITPNRSATVEAACAYDVELVQVRDRYTYWYVSSYPTIDLVLRNTGTCPWPETTRLALVSENTLDWQESWLIGVVDPGDEKELKVELAAPDSPQTLRIVWQLEGPDGEDIGSQVSYDLGIELRPTVTPTPTTTPLPPTNTPRPPSDTATPAPPPPSTPRPPSDTATPAPPPTSTPPPPTTNP